jgi:hypothetical protein
MLTAAELARSLPQALLRGDGRVRFTRVSTDSRSITAGALANASTAMTMQHRPWPAARWRCWWTACSTCQCRRWWWRTPGARSACPQPAGAAIRHSADRGHRQQRQDHGQGDDRRGARRGRRGARAGHPRQSQQRHRRAADVLRLTAQHRAAVVELGMNHPGRDRALAQHRAADGRAGQQRPARAPGVHGTVEATARENGAAIAALPADGVAVFPADDPHVRRDVAGLAGTRRVLEFGDTPRFDGARRPRANRRRGLRLLGRRARSRCAAIDGAHNVRNALAAAACCHRGRASRRHHRARAGRLQAGQRPGGVRMRAASGAIADRRQLQRQSRLGARRHRRARKHARRRGCWCWATWARSATRGRSSTPRWAVRRERGIDRLLAFGPASRRCRRVRRRREHFETIEALCEQARSSLAAAPRCWSRARARCGWSAWCSALAGVAAALTEGRTDAARTRPVAGEGLPVLLGLQLHHAARGAGDADRAASAWPPARG